MKIANKISISFFITAVIIFTITLSVIYMVVKNNLKESIHKHLQTAAESRAKHIETCLEEHKQSVELFASEIVFVEFLNTNRDTPEYSRRIEKTNSRMKKILAAHEEIFKVRILDKNGITAACTDESSLGSDKSADEIYLKVKESSFMSDIHYFKNSGTPTINLAAPVISSGEFLGVIVANLDAKELFKITLDRTGMGETGEIYLVNRDFYMVSPSRFKDDLVLKHKVETLNAINGLKHRDKEDISWHKEITVFPDYRGVNVLGTHAYIPAMQWALLAEIDEKEAFAPLNRIRSLFIALLVLIPIIAWRIGVWMSRIIGKPIQRLHEGAEIIGHGNLDYKIGINSKDEIGQLSRAFDRMTEDLKKSTASVDVLNKEITCRRRTEEVLRESETRFRTLVSNIPGVIYRCACDKNWTMQVISDEIEKVSGYPASDFIGNRVRSYASIIHPDDKLMVEKVVTKGLRQRHHYIIDYRIIDSEGHVHWVYEKGQGIYGDKNELLFLDGAIFDVSERKKVEEEREKLLHDIGERVKELNCLYGLSKLAEHENAKLEDIFNGTIELIPPSWQYPQYTCGRIIFDGYEYKADHFKETPWKQEAPIKTNGKRGGTVQVFYTKAFPESFEGPFLKGERNLINEIAMRLENIIQQKKSAELLSTERRRLSDILEGTNVGTWEWNVQTGETTFNERWANIIGYTLEELAPVSIDTWAQFAHCEDIKVSNELLEQHFSGKLDYYECETRMRHKNGDWVWVLDRGKVSMWTQDGKPLLMSGTHQDITERKEAEQKIKHMATHDALTGLPSLRLAKDRLLMAIHMAKRDKKISAVMFIDLDSFKAVNDNYGHDAGDALLKEVAKRFLGCVRGTDTVARIGGDEFLVILTGLNNSNNASQIAEKLVQIVHQPFVFKGNQLTVGASIGISLFPTNGEDVEHLIKQADEAMYRIKNSDKNGYIFALLTNSIASRPLYQSPAKSRIWQRASG